MCAFDPKTYSATSHFLHRYATPRPQVRSVPGGLDRVLIRFDDGEVIYIAPRQLLEHNHLRWATINAETPKGRFWYDRTNWYEDIDLGGKNAYHLHWHGQASTRHVIQRCAQRTATIFGQRRNLCYCYKYTPDVTPLVRNRLEDVDKAKPWLLYYNSSTGLMHYVRLMTAADYHKLLEEDAA